MLIEHLSGFKVFVNNWTNGNYLFWTFPTYLLLISFKITTFLLLLNRKIGKVAELWTLPEVGNPPLKSIKIYHKKCKCKSGLSHVLRCNLLNFLHMKECKVSFEIVISWAIQKCLEVPKKYSYPRPKSTKVKNCPYLTVKKTQFLILGCNALTLKISVPVFRRRLSENGKKQCYWAINRVNQVLLPCGQGYWGQSILKQIFDRGALIDPPSPPG